MPAAVAMFRRGAALGFHPDERLPLVILLFGIAAWAQLKSVAKVELPSAAMAR